MTNVRKSLLLSFVEKYSLLIIQTASTMILARLLSPEEIGIFSVGAVLVGFSHALRDLGVSHYVIQERCLTEEHIRSALGISLATAWGIAIVILAVSGAVADFYSETRVRQVLVVLAATFFFLPFSALVLALLRREMKFDMILRINTSAGLVGALTSVWLATLDQGFMSLAYGSFAQAITTLAAALLLHPGQMRFFPSFRAAKQILGYGTRVSLVSIMTEAAESAPDLVIGKVMGFAPAGIFSKGQGTVALFQNLVMGAINPVATPYFAQRTRDGTSLKDPYIRATTLITGLAWPFYACLGLLAYPVVQILFGDQWDAAVPIVQILCVSMALRTPATFNTPIFLSVGKARLYLRQSLLTQPLQIVLIVLASPLGLAAVVWALVLGSLVRLLVSSLYVARIIGLSYLDYVRVGCASTPVTLLSILVPAITVWGTEATRDDILVRISVGGLGAGAFWVGGLMLFRHPLVAEGVSLLKRAFPRFVHGKV